MQSKGYLCICVSSFLLLLLTPSYASEFDVLLNFYNSTNGDEWHNNTGWGTGSPCSSPPWFGISCFGTLVRKIQLGNNNLMGRLTNNLNELSSLSHIELDGNSISGEIPPTFGDIALLTYLNLAQNPIQGTLPPELGNVDLFQLIIADTALSGAIPSEYGETRLNYLDIRDNNIAGPLPSALANVTSGALTILGYLGEFPEWVCELKDTDPYFDFSQSSFYCPLGPCCFVISRVTCPNCTSPIPTPSPSPSPTPSHSPVPFPSPSPTPFFSPSPFPFPSPAPNPSPSPTLSCSLSPIPSPTPSPSPVPLPSPSSIPFSSPSPFPSPFPTPISSPPPSPSSIPPNHSPTPTPSPAPIPSPSPSPFSISSLAPSPTPTSTLVPFPTPSPYPSPSPLPYRPIPPSPASFSNIHWIDDELCQFGAINRFSTIDGSLYFCFDNMIIPSQQPPSIPCSLHLQAEGGALGDECQLSFVHRNVIKLSFSLLVPGDKLNISGFYNLSGEEIEDSLVVVPPPFSLTPLVIVSGPTSIKKGREVCWEVEGKKTGGREVVFTYSGDLIGRLVMKSGGGIGWGGETVCINHFEGLETGKAYWLGVEGRSELWGTIGEGGVMIRVEAGRIDVEGEVADACDLWESNPERLQGIVTYPSGEVYWGASVREEGVTVLMKGLGGCVDEMISKEILAAGNISWSFTEEEGKHWEGVNLNEFSEGTRLYLPPTLLLCNFPPTQKVGIEVSFEWEGGEEGGGGFLHANFSFTFLLGGVEFVLKEDPGMVVEGKNEVGSPLTLDFGSSLLQDEERGLLSMGGDQVWEWLWGCVNPLTGESCKYSDGQEVVLPGRDESKFVAEGEFSVGDPLQFVISVRVVLSQEVDREKVARGKWRRMFSVVESGEEMEFEFSGFGCLIGGQVGYNFRVPPQSGIERTKFESLLSEDDTDFGATEVFNIEESRGVAQLKCSCGMNCSEPILFRLRIEKEAGESTVFYGLFEPMGVLPPRGGSCESLHDTIKGAGEDEDIISGLSFVVVRCQGWMFAEGDISTVGQRVYYESEGAVYPRKQTVFGLVQFTVPCASVTLISDLIGFGGMIANSTTHMTVATLTAISWTNSLQPLFTEVQETLSLSSNKFIKTAHLYSTLQTMTLSCFLDGTFTPINAEDVLEDILDSDPPNTVEDVLNEAPILAVVTDPSQSQEIFDRFDDYLDVITKQGDLENGNSLSEAIVDGVSALFRSTNEEEVRDNGYDLLGGVQASLLCLMECGEDQVVSEGDLVTVGAQSGTLAQLAGQEIALGATGAYFLFPNDVSELEDEFGEGTCVYTGTSFVESNDPLSVPAASFTFYTLNCTTGEREEVAVTIDGEFVIVIPVPEELIEEGECEEESNVTCLSGNTLSSLNDEIGCHVIVVQEDHVVCGCRHLTAFSALIVPGFRDCGEWEWGILQTIAVSFIMVAIIIVVTILILEYRFIHRPALAAIKATIRPQQPTRTWTRSSLSKETNSQVR